ncbi:inactive polypeptide N-acetylgalactosaminyltransferase-like protein 5 [Callospermophilus lateralis]
MSSVASRLLSDLLQCVPFSRVHVQVAISLRGRPWDQGLGLVAFIAPLGDHIHKDPISEVLVDMPFGETLFDQEPRGSERNGDTLDQNPLYNNFNFSDPELTSGFLKYGLNIIVSKSLGYQRDVPDSRNAICLGKQYPVNLPTASVVICFYNEEFHVLFRTVSSVTYLTPSHLLEEIILVDDHSEYDDLKEKLDGYLEIFRGKIKLIRNKEREGLIRSRMIGAGHASGDVLVFLDSHCEVNRVWLEPLLQAISKNPKMVVCPLIDVIDEMTFEYKASPLVRGIFDWNLQFKWDKVFSYEVEGPDGPSKPIRSPAMAGGLFAINRHYFYEIGQYDKGMNFWGGENVEISLRIWMCGGQLYIIPCSRVGHVVRNQIKRDPDLERAVVENYLRVVHVWMDEHKRNPLLKQMLPPATVNYCQD